MAAQEVNALAEVRERVRGDLTRSKCAQLIFPSNLRALAVPLLQNISKYCRSCRPENSTHFLPGSSAPDPWIFLCEPMRT